MMADLTKRRIAFSGGLPVSAPATWGQVSMWLDLMELEDHSLYNQLHSIPVPVGLGIDSVLNEVGRLVKRYESLRTLCYLDGPHNLMQRVIAEGEVEVEVLTAASDDPGLAGSIKEQEQRLLHTKFDLSTALPIRFAVWVIDGVPQVVLLCASHFAADLQSCRILVAELTKLLAFRQADTKGPSNPVSRQPIELAAEENSSWGQAVLSRALDYWRSQLLSMPRTMFPVEPGPQASPRYAACTLNSPAAANAVDALAARYRISTSAVLVAATAALLCRYTGLHRCVIMLMASNRIAPGLSYAVGNIMQETPAVIDIRAESFGKLAQSTWAASLRAYRHARYDPRKMLEIEESVGRTRGVVIDHHCCYFNDTRVSGRRSTRGVIAPPTRLHTPAYHTRFTWKDSTWQEKFALEVFDRPGSILLELSADTCYLPPPRMSAFLFSIERLLTELVECDAPMTGLKTLANLSPPARKGRWALIEDCWVSLDAVRQLLRDAVDTDIAEAAVDQGRLVGYIRPRDQSLTAADIHAACLAALPGRQTAVVPQRFVIFTPKEELPSIGMAGGRRADDVRGAEMPDRPTAPTTDRRNEPGAVAESSRANRRRAAFDPMRAVARDFGESQVTLQAGAWRPPPREIRAMTFHRRWVGGRTLVLGCGSTHLYCMLSIADQVSHVTALDFAQPNLDATREMLDSLAGRQGTQRYVDAEHLVWLQRLAEALLGTSRFGDGTVAARLRDLVECHRLPHGGWDLLHADMFELAELSIEPADCILMSYALYVPRGIDPLASVTRLFTSIRAKLAPGGRLVLCDLPDFGDAHLTGDYEEAPGVAEKFTCDFLFGADFFLSALREAGLSRMHLHEDATGSAIDRQVFMVARKPMSRGKAVGLPTNKLPSPINLEDY